MYDCMTTSMTFDAHSLVLHERAVGDVVVALGVETVAGHFRHAPPTGLEIERAIDAIEDALMATRLGHASRGPLTTTSPGLRAVPGFDNVDAVLSLDEVERLFQELASATAGPSSPLTGWSADRDAAAALLILREVMHHLGFDRVRMAGTNRLCADSPPVR
jgi:exopolyphosphatase/pppGpp-phosphohydrolase